MLTSVLLGRARHMFIETFHSTFFPCISGDSFFAYSVNTQSTFDSQSTLIPGGFLSLQWHRDANASSLAWRFLAIVVVTGDAIACERRALEVRFHSTLACTLKRVHVMHSANTIIYFFIMKRPSWTGAYGIRKSFYVRKHPRNRRFVKTCALASLPSLVLEVTNEIKYSTFTLDL